MRRFESVLVVAAVFAAVCSVLPAAAGEVTLRPPTEAEIIDHFRRPSTTYGPGNRGLEYDTIAGDRIVASAGGLVIFAGPVAGTLHVTIEHGGDLLSTYSFVDHLLVRRGEQIAAGELIAIAGDGFHFGTRVSGRYVDPEELFGVRSVSVVLIPHDDRRVLGAWFDLKARSETLEIRELLARRSGAGLFDLVNGIRNAIVSVPFQPWPWLDPQARMEELLQQAAVIVTLFEEIGPGTGMVDAGRLMWRALARPPCTDRSVGAGPPAERRLAVVVDGLNSTSSEPGAMAGLDLERHGYTADDIVRFSYNGGVVPTDLTPGSWSAGIGGSDYSAHDTRRALAPQIAALIELLETVATANPGVSIDVYGHSLGGLITRHAVAAVGGRRGTVPVGVVVTFGAPNRGAPLAETAQALVSTGPGAMVTAALEPFWPDFILIADVVDDVSPSGFAGDTSGTAFPEGVTAVSIGARYDWVVPASTTAAPGARNVIVGDDPSWSAHGDLPSLEESDREVALALAGLPPACESMLNRLGDGLVSVGIERFEHSLAASVMAADVALNKG